MSERGEICTSIIVQSTNFYVVESRPEGIPDRVPEYKREVDPEVFEPKPGYSEGTYETAPPWDQKHHAKENSATLTDTRHHHPNATCGKYRG